MNRQEYILSKIVQECSEVQKVCTKAQFFGLDSVNHETGKTNILCLIDEWFDIFTAIEKLAEHINLDISNMNPDLDAKSERFEKFYEVSVSLGKST